MNEGDKQMASPREEARTAIDSIIGPLRDQAAKLDLEIEAALATVGELREAKSEIARLLRAAQPAQKRARPVATRMVATATIEALHAWLRQHRNNGQTFTAADLDRDPDFDLMSKASTNHALTALHEQGAIRLDARGTGGAKIYRLVG
jgi:hypothetical protein